MAIEPQKQRAILKGKLTRFSSFLERYDGTNSEDTAQLALRLSAAETLLDQFEEVQLEIEANIDDIESENATRENFEKEYFRLVAQGKQLLKSGDESLLANANHNLEPLVQQQTIKLPDIKLPTFDGKFSDWVNFHDTFISLVHSRPNLSDIAKFQYLKSSLRNEAIRVIQSIPITEKNYIIAWTKLIERYQDHESIILNHIKALFTLQQTSKDSPSSLRQLVDDASNHLQAIKALENTSLENRLLSFLIGQKLDGKTKFEWESTQIKNKHESIDILFTFLNERAKMLDRAYGNKGSNVNNKKSDVLHHRHSRPEYEVSAHLSTQETTCNFCKGNHPMFLCQSFLELPVPTRITEVKNRKLCINCLKIGHYIGKCASKKNCKVCHKRHNSLLHIKNENSENQTTDNLEQKVAENENSEASPPVVANCSNHDVSSNQTLLSTASILIADANGIFHTCRALLDCGSQSNFITLALCKKLSLPLSSISVPVHGIGQSNITISKGACITIQSRHTNFHTNLHCLVLPKISGRLPSEQVDVTKIKIPSNIKLADPNFTEPSDIDVLIGSNLFWSLLSVGRIQIPESNLLLSKTILGWIITGSYNISTLSSAQCNISIQDRISNQIAQFWETETCTVKKQHLSDEEQFCEQHFINTTRQNYNGQFIVKIPFKDNLMELGTSYQIAAKRFYSLEKKLEQSPSLKTLYVDFMTEYQQLGHMSEVINDDRSNGYYLPHHGVLREERVTSKLRVVFDGSCKTSSGISLNDTQYTGPPLQNDLFEVLVRFRQHKFVIKADIAKMYRAVLVDQTHQDYQKIVWRADPTHPLKIYQLNTVTYGTASAPYLAIRSLLELTNLHHQEFPLACDIIKTDFYVDDLLTGASTPAGLIQIKQEINTVLSRGGFELRKWQSNIQTTQTKANHVTPVYSTVEAKTLGVVWNSSTDNFHYDVKLKKSTKITKRSILSEISQVFDPLGLVGPCIILAKIMLQKLWLLKVDWDESLPIDCKSEWSHFRNQLPLLNTLSIPRYVSQEDTVHIEIHGFCDASQVAYGACIYVRTISNTGSIQIQLLCAKSRVAPVQTVSLPRLELNAALLLAQLASKVISCKIIPVDQIVYWSDSMITLCWIAGGAHKWKQYVANRVAEIQTLSETATWRYVPSHENPSDIISRGICPSRLSESELWWCGPKFLHSAESEWPSDKTVTLNEVPEQKTIKPYVSLFTNSSDDLLYKYSDLTKLVTCSAYLLRFVNNCRAKNTDKFSRTTGDLTPAELQTAEQCIVKWVQHLEFPSEIKQLLKNGVVDKQSKLLSLNPFLDKHQIIRVGGRITQSNCTFDKKHPIMLPRNHHFTKLVIQREHKRLLHAGYQTTLSSLRSKYWPLSGRSAVRHVLRHCIQCFRTNPSPVNQLMGDLPSYRLIPSKPFLNTGIDYAGPILIKEGLNSRNRVTKVYIALFVCMSTKAVHIEAVSSLTTEAFLATLNRFIARRGRVEHLFSDNGKNFVGANNELQRLKQLFNTTIHGHELVKDLTTQGISWHFIPPRAPNFGGLWEINIKCVKTHLKRVVGTAQMNFETLSTVLTQIEAVLNSRPITPLTNDPNDLTCLTPGHFLIGEPLITTPHPDVSETPSNRLTKWQHLEKLHQHFWKRWSKEYISSVQARSKWKGPLYPSISVGQLVVVKEDNLPPLQWLLGRIITVHPGRDGKTRVVTIKTSNSIITRAISKVCLLPIEQ